MISPNAKSFTVKAGEFAKFTTAWTYPTVATATTAVKPSVPVTDITKQCAWKKYEVKCLPMADYLKYDAVTSVASI